MIKRKVSKMIILGLIILCCSGILFIAIKYIQYDNYWDKLGRNYEQMKKLMGEPISVEENKGMRKIYYDEVTYLCDGKNYENVYLVIIENKSLKFGLFNIGVGTSRDMVEFIYSLKDKIKDLSLYDYGIVDGDVNVIFEFDKDKKVKKIYISDALFVV